MSLQFKKKRRSANLIQNNDISSEDEVSIVTNESKKPKVWFDYFLYYIVKYVERYFSQTQGREFVCFAFICLLNRNIKSDLSTERFPPAGGVTDTFDFEDKEQYWIHDFFYIVIK